MSDKGFGPMINILSLIKLCVWLSTGNFCNIPLPIFLPCKCSIFNLLKNIAARINRNANFNTISQNRIQKERILCVYFSSFLFFRPLHPLLPASATPLLLSLPEPLIPFALELVPMPIRYLTQYIQWDSGAGFISAHNHIAHHDSMCRCISSYRDMYLTGIKGYSASRWCTLM